MHVITRGVVVTASLVLVVASDGRAQGAPSITVGPGAHTVPTGASEIAGDPIPLQGQTFIVLPGFPVLRQFEFAVRNTGASYAPLFQIFNWDGSAPQGPALLSDVLPAVPGGQLQPAVFTGRLLLRPGDVYIATLSTTADLGIWLTPNNYPHYAGGEFTFFENGTWHRLLNDPDALFSATFSAVPEPSSFSLLGAGLASAAAVAWRRRRAATAREPGRGA